MYNINPIRSAMNPVLKTVISACLLVLLHACSNVNPSVANDGYTISKISVNQTGKTSKSRPQMEQICRGFIMSRNQVRRFFVYANHVYNDKSNKDYKILPCYATGTALINNQEYNWVIRSGGIGEFFNKKQHFVKICGKGCCSKVSGIC